MYMPIVWWGHLESNCWLSLYPAYCKHFCLNPSSHKIWQCINIIAWTQNKGLCVPNTEAMTEWKSYDLCQTWLFCCMVKEATTYWAWTQTDYIEPLNQSQAYQWYHTAIDTCQNYSVAITVQSADSGHILVILETNLCYVFSMPFLCPKERRYLSLKSLSIPGLFSRGRHKDILQGCLSRTKTVSVCLPDVEKYKRHMETHLQYIFL